MLRFVLQDWILIETQTAQEHESSVSVAPTPRLLEIRADKQQNIVIFHL